MASHRVEQDTSVPQVHEHGLGVRTTVMLRRQELELRLAELQNSEQQGTLAPQTIETALAALDSLLPAEHTDINPVIAEQLVRWLEVNKNLGVLDTTKKHRRTRS
jgi:hypothetical protein